MLAANGYATKKDLRASVGKRFRYSETSMFGAEYKPNSELVVVGPSAYKRVWYAQVTVDADGLITKVK